MPSFTVKDDSFLLNGEPFQIISGALHYFRIHPHSWRDRIRKAKELGLNTIETYIAWNFHAPTPDVFHTDGPHDLGRFLDLVAEEGLYAIVRPGPYICAEWDNGGLPVWLTAIPDIKIRSSDPAYLAPVEQYLKQLAPILEPRQIDHGGPIILFQVENEYGAYGNDQHYLQWLVDTYRDLGLSVPLTTVDQPQPDMLRNGTLPELIATGSFGSRASERLQALREFRPHGPLMCSEFWIGWFDSWGGHHHTTTVDDAVANLDEMLSQGASVNIYMFHGGTNFGFTSGADDKGTFKPTTTSYDYDALLAEDGYPTEKYWAFREVISRYAPVPDTTPAQRPPAPAFQVALSERAGLLESELCQHMDSETAAPASFEELEHYDGFVLHEHQLVPASPDAAAPDAANSITATPDAPNSDAAASGNTGLSLGRVLSFAQVHDSARVFLNGAPVGVVNRDHHDQFLTLPADAAGTLHILVENQGRVNYGPRIGESKGIDDVLLDGVPLAGWKNFPVDFTHLEEVTYTPIISATRPQPGPMLLRGEFELAEPANLYFSVPGWGKGSVWVNGFNMGRYWSRGPARTLYIPAELLKSGQNSIVVLELNGARNAYVRFVPEPDLGFTEA